MRRRMRRTKTPPGLLVAVKSVIQSATRFALVGVLTLSAFACSACGSSNDATATAVRDDLRAVSAVSFAAEALARKDQALLQGNSKVAPEVVRARIRADTTQQIAILAVTDKQLRVLPLKTPLIGAYRDVFRRYVQRQLVAYRLLHRSFQSSGPPHLLAFAKRMDASSNAYNRGLVEFFRRVSPSDQKAIQRALKDLA